LDLTQNWRDARSSSKCQEFSLGCWLNVQNKLPIRSHGFERTAFLEFVIRPSAELALLHTLDGNTQLTVARSTAQRITPAHFLPPDLRFQGQVLSCFECEV